MPHCTKYFCWIAFPVGIDSKKRSSSYFIRLHHGIPLASVNLVGGYRFHLSIFSFPWIAPRLQLCLEDRILAGIRLTLLRRKYWKNVVVVAFPIHFFIFLHAAIYLARYDYFVYLDTSFPWAPSREKEQRHGAIHCRIFRLNACRPTTANTTSG